MIASIFGGMLGAILVYALRWWIETLVAKPKRRERTDEELRVAMSGPPGSVVPVTPKERERIREKITGKFGVQGAQADQAADEIARALTQVPRGR